MADLGECPPRVRYGVPVSDHDDHVGLTRSNRKGKSDNPDCARDTKAELVSEPPNLSDGLVALPAWLFPIATVSVFSQADTCGTGS
jgi:hypothetical protein